MRTLRPARVYLFAWLVLLSACATHGSINPPLARHDPAAGYRFELLEVSGNSDRLFVIVTFSGGGTRAAALAYGVLEALNDVTIEWDGRRVPLLDEVDVISSVSGGSFPAAYYALHGRRIFDEFPDRFLYRSIQSELIRRLVTPSSLLKLAGAAYGRSDMAAEFYDQEVFGGARYAEIIAHRRKPFVILNATDMTTGTPFPFVQDQFDMMCSDLASVPVGRAAAASSAFPGALTPLTFWSYAGTCDYRQPPWVQLAADDHESRANRRRTADAVNRLSLAGQGSAKRPYIHLTDGGVADNIGLRGPLVAVTSPSSSRSVLSMINNERIDKLVVIAVNAATDPKTDRDLKAHVPGLIDTLTTAATVPLANYSFDTLELLSASVNEFNLNARLVKECEELAASLGPQCALDVDEPHIIELFPIQVTFDYIESADERAWFKNLPTTFQLPRETVDKLRAAGRRLLTEDPEFKNLLGSLNGCVAGSSGAC